MEALSLKLKPRCNQEAVECSHRHNRKCKVDSGDGSRTDQPSSKLRHRHNLFKPKLSRPIKTADQVSKLIKSKTFKTEDLVKLISRPQMPKKFSLQMNSEVSSTNTS